MKLARALGAIGRALISAGVIVLLFVAYQLWGTGLQHSQAQGDLEDDFLQLLDSDIAQQVQQVSVSKPATADDAADDNDVVASDESQGATQDEDGDATEVDDAGDDATRDVALPEADDEIFYSPEFLDVLYPAEGESLARVVIPAINVDQITVEGVSVEDLRKGPGHYPSTPNPGQAGNSAIAGHRTTYGAPFHRVDELQPGDEIIVTTIQGTFTYRVRANDAPDGTQKGYFIVNPSDTWVLGQESGENLLTLTACHPKYSARQRIIVQAELVGEPAPTPPRDAENDFEPVELDAGAEDEGGSDERASGGDDIAQVMSDEVAADDDPSVDADGTPLDGSESADNDGEPAGDDAEPDVDEATGADDATDADADDQEADDAADDAAAPSSDDIELISSSEPLSDDFGEGLNGDPTKIRPAIMWGLAGGAIWLAAWFIGQRLNRKWTLYLLGVVPFAPVLWSCFVNIDQALPSY